MMPSSINMAVLLGTIAVFALGALLGFVCRNRQLQKSQKRILELETEMVNNHAEILRLHKLTAEQEEPELEKVPVISLHKAKGAIVRKHS
jgi:Tfp pilus assembly protein PilN